jgi:hypothetical protein
MGMVKHQYHYQPYVVICGLFQLLILPRFSSFLEYVVSGVVLAGVLSILRDNFSYFCELMA